MEDSFNLLVPQQWILPTALNEPLLRSTPTVQKAIPWNINQYLQHKKNSRCYKTAICFTVFTNEKKIAPYQFFQTFNKGNTEYCFYEKKNSGQANQQTLRKKRNVLYVLFLFCEILCSIFISSKLCTLHSTLRKSANNCNSHMRTAENPSQSS